VNPLRPSSPRALAVHGISDADLALAETAETVLPEFVTFLGDPGSTTLLAHNASFDAGFLGRELARIGRPMPEHLVVDTLALARGLWPRISGGHKLDTLARWLGLDPHGSHRALADSQRVRGLWLALRPSDSGRSAEPLAYPIFDARRPPPAPRGWGWVEEAIGRDQIVRIEYAGGTRGLAPRSITPRRFAIRGGVAYLVALCHFDLKEKEFRLDRVLGFEVLAEPAS
jgi:DNA polymerase-3 subunit epsilon